MTDPREARLPKWAQEELSRLRMSLAREHKRNAELRGCVGETDTCVRNFGEDDQPLPKGASVQFTLNGQRYDQYVTVRVEDGALLLHGGRSLVIHPQVANAFRVTITD